MKLLIDIEHWAAAAVVASVGFCVFVVAVCAFYATTKRTIKAIISRMSWSARLFLGVAAASALIYGGSKTNLAPRSNADEGISLASVAGYNTNDVSRVVALSTGAPPSPMWYRPSTSNEWTLATEDGWTLAASVYLPEQGQYSNEWTRAETNFVPEAMYWFGANPPAVEVVVEGGLFMESWHATGRGVTVEWRIADDTPLNEGATVVLEWTRSLGSNAVWITAAQADASSTRSGTFHVSGWFVGFATRWRLKLEVPR